MRHSTMFCASSWRRFGDFLCLLLSLVALSTFGILHVDAVASQDMANKVVETAFAFEHVPRRLVYFKDSEVRPIDAFEVAVCGKMRT